LGIAKECAALLNLKISFPSIKIKEGKEKSIIFESRN